MFSDEIIKQMVGMGTLGYPPEKIINILDLENQADEFYEDFSDPSSDIYKAYKKGQDKADYAIDIKIYELAVDGDLKALKLYEERKEERNKTVTNNWIPAHER